MSHRLLACLLALLSFLASVNNAYCYDSVPPLGPQLRSTEELQLASFASTVRRILRHNGDQQHLPDKERFLGKDPYVDLRAKHADISARTIAALAPYLSDDIDMTIRTLFAVFKPPQGWKEFSANRKLEYVFGKADDPEAVGRAFAFHLDGKYESVASNDVLRPLLSGQPKSPITFADAALPLRPLPERYGMAIDAIVRLCRNLCEAFGGVTVFLEDVLGVPDASSILAAAKDTKHLIYLGLTSVSSEKQRAGMRKAIDVLEENYEGARLIPEFAEFKAITDADYAKTSGERLNEEIARNMGYVEPVEQSR